MKFKELVGLTPLAEAAFSEKNLEKVALLYSKIMSKKMGGTFLKIGTEDFKKSSTSGKGIRFMNNTGHQLRFNWDAGNKSKSTLSSIDYWKPKNTNMSKASTQVKFGPNLNVIQVLDTITTALLTNKINEAEEVINEARTADEKRQWLTNKGLPKSLAGSMNAMKSRADDEGLLDELEVFLGEKESNSLEENFEKTEKVFSGKMYADPDTVFDDIEDLLSVVAAGKWRTLVVCGMGGVGKTWHITEGPRSLNALLGPVGGKWEYHSGSKAAPFSFYKTLFQERNKVIVFDEADSILKNDDIVMMLKPILDTSGDNMAAYMSGTENMVGKSIGEIIDYGDMVDGEIASGTPIGIGKNDVKLPSKFKFDGGMVFISNMSANQIEGAIMSRSLFVDVHLAQQDVIKRIQSIAMAKYAKQFGEEYVKELMEGLSSTSKAPETDVQYMTPEYARKSKPFTIRSLDVGHILKQSGLSRWKELAQMYG